MPFGTVERGNEIGDVAFKGVRKPHEHRQARQRQPALHVADERVIGVYERGELLLGEAAREAELAQVAAEDDAVALSLRHDGMHASR